MVGYVKQENLVKQVSTDKWSFDQDKYKDRVGNNSQVPSCPDVAAHRPSSKYEIPRFGVITIIYAFIAAFQNPF
jgi:hypothetical protein